MSCNSIPSISISVVVNVGVGVIENIGDMLLTLLLGTCTARCLLGRRPSCRTGGNAISIAISMILNTRHVTPSATVIADDTTLFWTGGRFMKNCASCERERAKRQYERLIEIHTSKSEEVRPVNHTKSVHIEVKEAESMKEVDWGRHFDFGRGHKISHWLYILYIFYSYSSSAHKNAIAMTRRELFDLWQRPTQINFCFPFNSHNFLISFGGGLFPQSNFPNLIYKTQPCHK